MVNTRSRIIERCNILEIIVSYNYYDIVLRRIKVFRVWYVNIGTYCPYLISVSRPIDKDRINLSKTPLIRFLMIGIRHETSDINITVYVVGLTETGC